MSDITFSMSVGALAEMLKKTPPPQHLFYMIEETAPGDVFHILVETNDNGQPSVTVEDGFHHWINALHTSQTHIRAIISGELELAVAFGLINQRQLKKFQTRWLDNPV